MPVPPGKKQRCRNPDFEEFRRAVSGITVKKKPEEGKYVYKKDYLFMFAWNEWGESGYLEPDELYGFKMLEAVRDALLENNEFPIYPNFEK